MLHLQSAPKKIVIEAHCRLMMMLVPINVQQIWELPYCLKIIFFHVQHIFVLDGMNLQICATNYDLRNLMKKQPTPIQGN